MSVGGSKKLQGLDVLFLVSCAQGSCMASTMLLWQPRIFVLFFCQV